MRGIKTGATSAQRLLNLSRRFSTTTGWSRGRNLLAKYAPSQSTAIPAQRNEALHGSQSINDEFITSATQPVGTSFQTVPPPDSPASVKGVQVKEPIPAMLPSAIESKDGEVGKMGEPLEPSQRRKTLYVEGIPIPPEPRPPGEEECCMSGCIHCVYTIYADELEEYNETLKSAKDKLVKAGVPPSEWPDELAKDMGGDGAKEKEKVLNAVDPSMAAFLALEGKLKSKG